MSSNQTDSNLTRDRMVNTCAGLIFAALGALVILGSQKFESSGSVTPIFIGASLIILSLILVVTGLVASRTIPMIEAPSGSLLRRGIGVLVIIVWVTLLPHLGFLPTSIPAFIAISFIVPSTEPWTVRKIAWHAVTAVAVAVVFWFALTSHLGIALPEARFPPFN